MTPEERAWALVEVKSRGVMDERTLVLDRVGWVSLIAYAIQQAVEEERAACAMVADGEKRIAGNWDHNAGCAADQIAEKIRARSKA